MVSVPILISYLGARAGADSLTTEAGTARAGESAGGGSGRTLDAPATQTSEGGDLVVAVTWQGPGAGLLFNVVMDTHSVDLDGYDLSRSSVLMADGKRESVPVGWDAPKGGHHRKGNLTFEATALDGKPFITPDTRTVELTLYDIAGVPQRSFRWTLR